MNGQAGSGEWFLVEADESDGSFLLLWPEIAVVTNVEADHLENHGDLEGVFRAFEQFVDRIAAGGLLLYCADDAGARRIAEYARDRAPGCGRDVRVRGYGTGPRRRHPGQRHPRAAGRGGVHRARHGPKRRSSSGSGRWSGGTWR